MNVEVRSLSVTVSVKDKEQPKRQLLNGVSFGVAPGDVVALMGPSGAGKTTMLNRLVGRGINGEVQGSIRYDGRSVDKARSAIGYVTQDDIMYETLTPRENLEFAAAFQQGNRSAKERSAAVEAVMATLRLTKCADTVVGTPGIIKGISGGERKRTNVAMSLLNNPHLLLLDEPTSGLDAKLADELMVDVALAARNGCTVMATIHQPSEAVFSHFTKLLLLNAGKVAYFGHTAGLAQILSDIGFPTGGLGGVHVPLPETLLEVLEVPKDASAAEAHSSRLATLRSKSIQEDQAADASPADSSGKEPLSQVKRLGFGGTLVVLTKRNLLNFRRSKVLTLVRFMQTILSTLFISWIFNQLDSNMAGVNARMFGVFLLAFLQFLFAMLGVVNTFPAERAVFLREAQDKWYHPGAFFLAKVVMDTVVQSFFPILVTAIGYPIMGLNADSAERVLIFYVFSALLSNGGAAMGFIISAAVSSVNSALSIAPGMVTPQLILCGVFMKIDLLPEPFRAISHLVMMRYGLQGVLTNEFTCDTSPQCTSEAYREVFGSACSTSPCDFCCEEHEVQVSGGICSILTCDDALNSLGLAADDIWPSGDTNSDTIALNILALACLVLWFRFVGMVVLMVSFRHAAKSG